jgi:hypothetical protein
VLDDLDRRILEDRELIGDARRQTPQHLDVQRKLAHLERRRQLGRIDLQGIGFVAAQHETAALVANVDVGVDYPGDRELGAHARDRLGDQELVAGRHDLERPAKTLGDEPGPRAGGVDDDARGDDGLRRAHALDAARTDLEADGRRMGQQGRADLLRRAAVAERQLGGLDVAVGRAPGDGDDAALAQDGQSPPRLDGRHEVDRDAGLSPPLDLARELGGIALVAGDLERAALREPQGLPGFVGERGELHHRAAGDRGQRRGRADLAGEPGRAG